MTMPALMPGYGANFVAEGLSIRVWVPAGETLNQGDAGEYDGFFGFNLTAPMMDPDGGAAILQIQPGIYETRQVEDGAVIAVGQTVYWQRTAHRIGPAGDRAIGILTSPRTPDGSIQLYLTAQVPQ